MSECVCVCVCVCERERERKEGERGRERERGGTEVGSRPRTTKIGELRTLLIDE